MSGEPLSPSDSDGEGVFPFFLKRAHLIEGAEGAEGSFVGVKRGVIVEEVCLFWFTMLLPSIPAEPAEPAEPSANWEQKGVFVGAASLSSEPLSGEGIVTLAVIIISLLLFIVYGLVSTILLFWYGG